MAEAELAASVSKLVRGKNAVTVAPITEDDRTQTQGKRAVERFTAANRSLMLRVRESSEALRQICLHTDRLREMWISAAKADAANDAIIAILDAEDDLRQSKTAYNDVLAMLARVFDAEKSAGSGGDYSERNPGVHARRYVQRAVWKFVKHAEFRSLSSSVRLFHKPEAPRSNDLIALANACDCLSIEAEALQSAASRQSAGADASLNSFLDRILRVEELATTVSDLAAQLLPDLRSVPSAMTVPETD